MLVKDTQPVGQDERVTLGRGKSEWVGMGNMGSLLSCTPSCLYSKRARSKCCIFHQSDRIGEVSAD